jgi:hypothetical protein
VRAGHAVVTGGRERGLMDEADDLEGTWGVLVIRAWREYGQPSLRLHVVAKADVRVEGEERRYAGSVDEVLAFSREWLEALARRAPDRPQ